MYKRQEGYNTILSVIKQPNDSYEYAISFSLAYKEYGDFTFTSRWAVDEYPASPNYLNFQIWANTKAMTIAAVRNVISKILSENHLLKPENEAISAPQLFAKSAYYRLGVFHMDLHNNYSEAMTLNLFGSCNTKEVAGETIQFDEEMQLLPGQTTVELDLPFGNVFDGEITLLSDQNQKDVIYLADGAWGLDYDPLETSVEQYEIISESRIEPEDEYLIERGVAVSGHTDSYIAIFKQLVPGGRPIDLSAFNTLSFDSNRRGTYEVSILAESEESDLQEKFSYILQVEAGNTLDIPLSLFSNSNNATLDKSKITTVFLAFVSEHNESDEFDLSIENMRFRNDSDAEVALDLHNLDIHPNPSSGQVMINHRFIRTEDVTLTVHNPAGVKIHEQKMHVTAGLEKIELNLDASIHALYVISLRTKSEVYRGSLLIGN